jgi:hypothetical protein
MQEDWMFLVLLVVAVTIAAIKYTYPRRLQRLLQSLFRVRMLQQLMREEMVMTHHSAIALFISFALTSALLLYFAAVQFNWPLLTFFGPWFYPAMAAAVIALYLFKVLLISVIRVVFLADGGMWEYLNYSFVMNALLGIAWLPVAVVVMVSTDSLPAIFLLVAGAVFSLAWLIRIAKGIQFAIQHHVLPVYIFLYLCTLEILPLAVIAKGIAEVRF